MRRALALVLMATLLSSCSSVPFSWLSKGKPPDPVQPPAPAPAPAPDPDPAPSPHPSASSTRELSIEAQANAEGMKGVELWSTEDGGMTWKAGETFPGAVHPMSYVAPHDGRFGFAAVPVMPDGSRLHPPSPGTEPEVSILVDTDPPLVILQSPNGGNLFPNRGQTSIRWTAKDTNLAEKPITIEVSPDGGSHWAVVVKDHANDGQYLWDLPVESSKQYLIRVTARDVAGNTATATSEAPFIVDGFPPEGRVLGPQVSTRGEVSLQYTAGDPGGAGLAKVSLWVTTDGGATWTHAADDTDTLSPFEASLPDGRYGLALVCVDRVGNASEVPQRGTRPTTTLLVDSTPPVVALCDFPKDAVFSGDEDVDLSWTVTEENPKADGVTVELSEDGGSTWAKLAAALPPDKPFRWRTPSKLGRRYRLRVTAEDAAGNIGCATGPDFAIDGGVPEAFFQGPAVSASRSVDVSFGVRNLGFAPLARVELWVMRGRDTHWEKAAEGAAADSVLHLDLPDGLYSVKATCATKRGIETGKRQPVPDVTTQPDGTILIDASKPVVKLTSPKTPCAFRGGATVEIAWTATDERLAKKPVRIEASSNDGHAWKDLEKGLPAEGTWRWTLPVESGDAWRVRVSAEDEAGNVGSTETEAFGVFSKAPGTHVVGPVVLNAATGAEASIAVEALDAGAAGVSEVVLYKALLGPVVHWEVAQRLAAAPFEAKVGPLSDGKWGFVAVACDKVGNRGAAPGPQSPPDLTISVDTTPPRVTLLAPRGGEVVQAGATVDVRWQVEDEGPISFTIQVSNDGGRTWEDLVADVAGITSGHWTLARGEEGAWRVRVIGRDPAGNEASATTAEDILSDARPPVAVVKGPSKANSGSVDLDYDVEDAGPAGPGVVQLWTRSGEEREWKPGPSADVSGGKHAPLRLVAADGTYDLFLSATDRVGNASAQPTPANEAQARITIDSSPPHVLLLAPAAGACVRGGAPLDIRWQAADEHLGSDCVRIDWSSDDGATWSLVASGLGNEGKYAWTVPGVDGDRYRVRVTVADTFGNKAEAVSAGAFIIDSHPPVATVVGPATWSSRDGEVLVQAHDEGLAGIANVELWTSVDRGATWSGPVAARWADGRVSCRLPEGRIGLFAVATDRAGNQSALPAPGAAPQAELVVDARVPRLSVRGLAEGDLIRRGEPLTIVWETTEGELPAAPVRVEVVPSQGAPIVLRDAAPASDKTAWTPSEDGAFVLRVTATNLVGGATRFEAHFEVDGSAPAVAWVKGTGEQGVAGGREVELAWESRDDHLGEQPVSLFFSPDRGATWQAVRAELPASGRTIWRVPEVDCVGSCLLKLVAKDLLGNSSEAVSDKPFSIVTSATPVEIEIPAATREGRFTARARWALDRAAYAFVEAWQTDDGGKHWQQLSTTKASEFDDLPLVLAEGRHGISLSCVRDDGTRTEAPHAGAPPQYSILVDTTPPSVSVLGAHDGDIVEAGGTVEVSWEVRDEDLGATPVSVVVLSDKHGKWRELQNQPARGAVQVPTDPEAGEMTIEVHAKDPCGNEAAGSVRLVLDSDVPQVTIDSPVGSVVRGGAVVPVSWKASDSHLGDRPVELRESTNGGRTWRTVARNLPATGQASWTAPLASIEDVRVAVRVRDREGREASAALASPISVDATAPEVRIAPVGIVAAQDVQVCCDAQDDLSGVAAMELWVRPAGEARWECAGRAAVGSAKFPLARLDGTYELLAVATDGVGNRSSVPDDMTPAMTTVVFARQAPTLDVFGMERGVRARAGGTLDVEWEARGAIGVKSVWIEVGERAGGARTAVRTSLPAAGAFSLPLPPREGALRVWVRAQDIAGHVTPAEIPVELVAGGPIVRVFGVEGGSVHRGGDVLHLRWKVEGSGLAEAPVSVAVGAPGLEWVTLKDSLPAEGALDMTLPMETRDVFRIRVCAADASGQTSETVTTIAVDSSAPQCAISAPRVQKDRSVRVTLHATDVGRAGVRRVTVYGRPRGQADWRALRELSPEACEQAVTLTLDEGTTELFACASDCVGNEAPAPSAKTEPSCSVEVCTRAPRVMLVDLPSMVQKAPGSRLAVAWKSEISHPADGPVRISVVAPAGDTRSVVGALPASGHAEVEMPLEMGEYTVRIEARDVAGNVGAAAFAVEVTDHPTDLHVTTPLAGGSVFRGGTTVPLSWDTGDKGSVTVLVCEGASGAWMTIGKDLGAHGEVAIPLPPRDVESFFVQVESREGGRSTLLAKYCVAVAAHAPRAKLTPPPASAGRRVHVHVDTEDEGVAGVAKVVVLARVAGGRGWREVGSSADPGDVVAQLDDGKWELCAVAEDSVGNRSAPPSEDAPAPATVVVDTTAPAILLADSEDPLPIAPGSTVNLSWEAQDDHPAPDGVEIAWGPEGQPMTQAASGLPAKGSWQGRAPDSEGTWRIRITARDAFGNTSASERMLRVASRPGSTAADVSAKEGDVVRPGQSVSFRWDAGTDEFQEKGVSVLLSIDGGLEFKPLAEGLDRVGTYTWSPKHDVAKAMVKIVARERGGRWRELLAPRTFSVLIDRPRVALLTETVWKERSGLLTVKPATQGREFASVRLWTTADGGQTWTDAGEGLGSPCPMKVDLPGDGKYGLYASARDTQGAEWDPAPTPGTEPQAAVIVDTASPRVTLKTFQEGGAFAGGSTLLILWEAQHALLKPDGVSLFLSADGGRRWTPIARGLRASGRYPWTLPRMSGGTFRLKVTAEDEAGKVGEACSAKDFTIDSTVPRVEVDLPDAVPSPLIECAWRRIGLAVSPVTRVTAWVTADGGKTWAQAEMAGPGKPLKIALPGAGIYGFAFVAESEVGNKGSAPEAGMPPERSVLVDLDAPRVKITAPAAGQAIRAGEVEVRWVAEDERLAEKPVTIEVSEDGGKSWSPTSAEPLTNLGRATLSVPSRLRTLQVKVTVRDAAGHEGSAVAGPWSIRTGVVSASITGVSPDGAVSYVAEGGGIEIAAVELWTSADAGKAWTMASRVEGAHAKLSVAAKQGRVGLWVVAEAGDGERSEPPTEGAAPMRWYHADGVPPSVRLLSPHGGETFAGGKPHEVTWSAGGEELGDRPIHLWMSQDDGKTWAEASDPAGLPNSGAVSIPMPAATGRGFRLRVIAVDAFGAQATSETMQPFSLDADAPKCCLTGPQASARSDVALSGAFEDVGPAGVARVDLYERTGGKWVLSASAEAGKPLVFHGVDGEHRLAVAGIDCVGNAQAPPSVEEDAQLTLRIDTRVPEVHLEAIAPRVKGSSAYEVRWVTHLPRPGKGVAKLEWSRDGATTWQALQEGVPDTGAWSWSVPAVDEGRCRLRVSVVDAEGQVGVAETPTDFQIVTKAPHVRAGFVRPSQQPSPAAQQRREPAPVEQGKRPSPQPAAPQNPPPAAPAPATVEGLKGARDLYDHGRYAEAAEACKGVLATDLKCGEAHYRLAMCLTLLNQEEEAASEFGKAVAIEPKSAEVRNAYGVVLLMRKDLEGAEWQFRAAAETGTDAMSHHNLGTVLYQKKEYEEARKEFETAIGLNPKLQDSLFYLGYLDIYSTQWEKARARLEECIAVDKESETAEKARKALETLPK